MNNLEKNYLSHPQRQSPKGVLVLFGYTLYKAVRALFPLLLIVLLKKNDIAFTIYHYLGLAMFLILIFTLSFLNYWYFTFYIDATADELVIQKGWLTKSKTVIKLNKIQQVNLNQKIIHQLLQVYEVEIDTAGTKEVEVKIKAVSRPIAEQLRLHLLEHAHHLNEGKTTANVAQITTRQSVPQNVIEISLASLIKVGLTRRYVQTFALIFVFVFQGLEQYRQYFESEDEEVSVYAHATDYASHYVTDWMIPILIAGVFLLIILANLIRTLIQYYHYKIDIHDHKLLISYGLMETKNTIIKPSRVQFLQVTQNYVQRFLDVFELKIVQTEQDASNGKKGKGIDVPGVSFVEKERILAEIFKINLKTTTVLAPSLRKFIVHAAWLSVFPAACLLSYAAYHQQVYTALGGVVFLLFTLFYHWIIYRNARLYWNAHCIAFRKGFWDVHYQVFEPSKIQKIDVFQRLWHKKLDLGSIVIYTAGGDFYFTVANYTSLKKQVNVWLYEVESKNLNWM